MHNLKVMDCRILFLKITSHSSCTHRISTTTWEDAHYYGSRVSCITISI